MREDNKRCEKMSRSIPDLIYGKTTSLARLMLGWASQFKKGKALGVLLKKCVISLRKNGISATIAKIRKRLPAKKNILSKKELQEQRKTRFDHMVKFSVLVPLYNTPEKYLHEMIQSVLSQTYSNWELCLADGSDVQHGNVGMICEAYAQQDNRIRYMKLIENKGISENTNACAQMATGEYIVLLDHDDTLAINALFENAKKINDDAPDVIYSDEDHISLLGHYINPFYKPDWSPDLLYSQMYICHLLVFKKALLDKVNGFHSEYNGAQDYDLILRLSEQSTRISHIAKILYHWRESENSTAVNADSKPYAHENGRNALDAHLKRKYGENAYAEDGCATFVYNPRFKMTNPPLVSIIIPMKDKCELTEACVKSILKNTAYSKYEILILDNRSEQEKTKKWLAKASKMDSRIRVIAADMEFNWSKINNFGIREAKGDVFVCLNNDTLIISPDWLERLAENALRDDVGVVGPLLLYEDKTIQHAGIVVGFGGWADHVFKGMKPLHNGDKYVSPMVSRNVLAVTGACLVISRATIEKIGGFDETFVVCGSDVELGIRAYEKGLINRYDARVRLYHLESKSRDAAAIPEIDFKRSYDCYTPYREKGDPYYNCNLDLNSVVPKEK